MIKPNEQIKIYARLLSRERHDERRPLVPPGLIAELKPNSAKSPPAEGLRNAAGAVKKLYTRAAGLNRTLHAVGGAPAFGMPCGAAGAWGKNDNNGYPPQASAARA